MLYDKCICGFFGIPNYAYFVYPYLMTKKNNSDLKSLDITYLPIKSLIPYQFNNRIHSDSQVNLISNSIEQFGFNQPIVVDEANIILVGHGRLLAAEKLGMTTVPVYKLLNLSEAQKKAYRILDNKLQNDSEWDFPNIEIELNQLDELGFDTKAWGLDSLRLTDDEELEIEEDAGPGDIPDEPYIKLGDYLELGSHRVWCADVTAAEKLPVLADMWITDPPYGVAYKGKTKKALTLENDDLDSDALASLWCKTTAYALDNMKEGGACYASIPPGILYFTFLKEWIEREVYRQQLIWVKDSMVLGHSDYHYKHETVLYGWKPGAAHYFTNDRSKVSTLEFDRPKASREHPTMKPLALWAEMIQNSTKKGEIVLDTFLGSGTTLLAADQLGRICYGYEIDPRYCQVILERYQKYCEQMKKPFVCKINGEVFK